jgi:deoxyribodipyrimidine photolyase
MKILIWFHRDLRTYDHEILHWIHSENLEAIGVAGLTHLNPISFQALTA